MQLVKGRKSIRRKVLVREIMNFSMTVRKIRFSGPVDTKEEEQGDDDAPSVLEITANAATKMFEEVKQNRRDSLRGVPSPKISVNHIPKERITQLIAKAKKCLAWAHDPERELGRGAEHVTKEQV